MSSMSAIKSYHISPESATFRKHILNRLLIIVFEHICMNYFARMCTKHCFVFFLIKGKSKGKFIYGAISKLKDCSKHLTTWETWTIEHHRDVFGNHSASLQ